MIARYTLSTNFILDFWHHLIGDYFSLSPLIDINLKKDLNELSTKSMRYTKIHVK
jgi:hypothetical protein